MSARAGKVDGHWDTLDKSSSTASSCRLSWMVPGLCREMTIALVLSARSILWRHRSRAWLTSCRAFDILHGAYRAKLDDIIEKQRFLRGKGAYLSFSYCCLIIVLAHGDGLLRWDHVPQTIASQDDVAVLYGVEGYYTCVWLGRNYKLSAVEVIAPKISCCRKKNILNNTTADLSKHYNDSEILL